MALKRFLFLILVCSFSGTITAQTSEKEANLKAAFIYNFTKYIEWDSNNEDDFIIGVMGSSPVTASLNEIAKTNMVNNKKITVRVFSKPEDIGDCNILFIPVIPENSLYSLQSILDKADKGMLTISEEPGFAKQGTAFNFFITNDKLKFEANLKTLLQSGLKVSSQLLKLAKIVD